MGRMVDDELIVVSEDENPMEELKNYTKKEEKAKIHPKPKNQKAFLAYLNLAETNFFLLNPFC